MHLLIAPPLVSTAPNTFLPHVRGFALRLISTRLGELLVVADGAGLRFIAFTDRRSLGSLLRRRVDGKAAPGGEAVIDHFGTELSNFLDGGPAHFTTPLQPVGTPFQKRVWTHLQCIPAGATLSYGELATRVGSAEAIRAVANAVAANPLAIAIPCHRIIGKNGKLTGYADGLARKRTLLELEKESSGPQTR